MNPKPLSLTTRLMVPVATSHPPPRGVCNRDAESAWLIRTGWRRGGSPLLRAIGRNRQPDLAVEIAADHELIVRARTGDAHGEDDVAVHGVDLRQHAGLRVEFFAGHAATSVARPRVCRATIHPDCRNAIAISACRRIAAAARSNGSIVAACTSQSGITQTSKPPREAVRISHVTAREPRIITQRRTEAESVVVSERIMPIRMATSLPDPHRPECAEIGRFGPFTCGLPGGISPRPRESGSVADG